MVAHFGTGGSIPRMELFQFRRAPHCSPRAATCFRTGSADQAGTEADHGRDMAGGIGGIVLLDGAPLAGYARAFLPAYVARHFPVGRAAARYATLPTGTHRGFSPGIGLRPTAPAHLAATELGQFGASCGSDGIRRTRIGRSTVLGGTDVPWARPSNVIS